MGTRTCDMINQTVKPLEGAPKYMDVIRCSRAQGKLKGKAKIAGKLRPVINIGGTVWTETK